MNSFRFNVRHVLANLAFLVASCALNPEAGAVQYSATNGMVVGWGSGYYSQCWAVPTGLSNVVAVSSGSCDNWALKNDGTIVAWGSSVTTNELAFISRLSNIVAISLSYQWGLALRANGTVVGWGDNTYGQLSIPADLTGVVSIAVGQNHGLALKSDGRVVGWGSSGFPDALPPPALSGVVSIAAYGGHSLAARSDGSVFAWGDNPSGRFTPPAGLKGVVRVATSDSHSLALLNDGTVVGWGSSYGGGAVVPDDLHGVAAIAAGQYYSVALKSNGTVRAWGLNTSGQTAVPLDIYDAIGISAGGASAFAVVNNTPGAPRIVVQPQSQAVKVGSQGVFNIVPAGPTPRSYQWRRGTVDIGGATNSSLNLINVQPAVAGDYSVVVSNPYGSVTSTVVVLSITTNSASVIVNSTDEFGPGSLQQAILDANATYGGNIQFTNLASSIHLTRPLPPIIGDLNIVGMGVDKTRIIGSGTASFFSIPTGATCTISRLTLQGSAGTAMSNVGLLRVREVVIRDFEKPVVSSGSLTVLNSTLTNNYGGGIVTSGNLYVWSSVIGGSGGGSGIVVLGGSNRIERTVIVNNVGRGMDGRAECVTDPFNPYGIRGWILSNPTDGLGGGVKVVSGSVAMTECTISGNRVYGGNAVGACYPYPISSVAHGFGGGIFLAFGDLRMTNCTVSGNYAVGGNGTASPRSSGTGGGNAVGGVYCRTGSVLLVNCTISGNNATGGRSGGGGGFGGFGGPGGFAYGGIRSDIGSILLLSSTITGNIGTGGLGDGSFWLLPAGSGIGGLWGPSNVLQNCIVAGNVGSSPTSNSMIAAVPQPNDASGQLTSLGHNLIGTTNPFVTLHLTNYLTGFAATDILNAVPRLGPLANNGGLTYTHRLLPGSPAIDAGINTGVVLDQRWRPRTCDGRRIPNTNESDGTDMGAVEADQSMCYQNVVPSGNNVLVWFTTDSGIRYGAQYKPELSAPEWITLPVTVVGNGNLMWFTDNGARLLPRRFYRLFEITP